MRGARRSLASGVCIHISRCLSDLSCPAKHASNGISLIITNHILFKAAPPTPNPKGWLLLATTLHFGRNRCQPPVPSVLTCLAQKTPRLATAYSLEAVIDSSSVE